MSNNKLSIILLEDDEALRFVLGRALSRLGHEVSECADLQALNRRLEGAKPVDLVVMDLKLQHETSLGMIADVRKALPNATIFIVTAYASIATTVEAIKQGADDYLPKPVNAEDILGRYHQLQSGHAPTPNDVTAAPLSPKRLEWEHIQQVLQQNNGNISETARQLNMHRRTLQRKLQKKPQK